MKNFWKILGIIALVAVIGFSMAACGGDDDDDTKKPGTDTPGTDTPGTDTPGTDTPGTDTPSTGGDNAGVYSAIAGTWVGDESNGTLVVNKDGFSTTSGAGTGAFAVVTAINQMKSGGPVYVENGQIGISMSGTKIKVYTYVIEGSILTISDDRDGPVFTGTKQ